MLSVAFSFHGIQFEQRDTVQIDYMRKLRVTRSIIPNLFTLMNLFGGFIAIIHIARGEYLTATSFIIMAGFFDLMDGAVARLIKATSEFGVELDSLCDAVSFGIAPSFMIYMVFFREVETFGVILAFLPAMAGVMRLARFNVQIVGFEDKRYFTGMPIPAGALTIISYTIYYHNGTLLPEDWKPAFMIAVTVLTAAAMVSTVKYDNFPRLSKRAIKERPFVLAFFVIGILGAVFTRGAGLFPFMATYIMFGFVRHIILALRHKWSAEDEADTHEQPDPDPFEV